MEKTINMAHITIAVALHLIVKTIPAIVIAVFFICSPFYGLIASKAQFSNYFHKKSLSAM
ncbi:MAG: hypothetical protein WCR66_08745 [Bacteroidota bacterium]